MKLTDAQLAACHLEEKLSATKAGQTCILTYEECHELACYMRQRTGLIDAVTSLSTRAVRAVLYIVSIWRSRGSGEIYRAVQFNHDGKPIAFYYNRLLKSLESVQKQLMIIDPDLTYGEEDE